MSEIQEPQPPTPSGNRVLRYAELRGKVGFSRSHIHALVAEGKFPPPLVLVEGGRASGWLESEVDAWLAQRVAARDSARRA